VWIAMRLIAEIAVGGRTSSNMSRMMADRAWAAQPRFANGLASAPVYAGLTADEIRKTISKRSAAAVP